MNFILCKRLSLKRFTVADATYLKRMDRSETIRIGRRFRFKVGVLVFSIPLETCLSRNAGRDRTVPEEAVYEQYKLLKETLTTIRVEGFDYVFEFGEREQKTTSVEIS
jgi:predicted kinase